MNFQPTGNRVLVELDEVTATESGLYIPQTAQTGPKKGTVVAAGTHYYVGSTKVECQFSPGDKVLVDELGGMKLRVDGKDLIVVRNEDVIGFFRGDFTVNKLALKDAIEETARDQA